MNTITITEQQADLIYSALSQLIDQMILEGDREQQVIDAADYIWSQLVSLYN